MKVIHVLPRSQDPKKMISYMQDSMVVENLEELLDFSLQEIIEPLDHWGPESPTAQVFSHSPPQYQP